MSNECIRNIVEWFLMFLCLRVSPFSVPTTSTLQSTLAEMARTRFRIVDEVEVDYGVPISPSTSESLADLVIINRLFEYNTAGFYIRQIPFSMAYGFFLIRVLQLPLLEDVRIRRPTVFGPVPNGSSWCFGTQPLFGHESVFVYCFLRTSIDGGDRIHAAVEATDETVTR